MVGPGVRVGSEEEKEDFPEEVDFRVKSLIKAQQPKDPGHFAADYPEKSKNSSQKPTEGKKFEDYTYAYGGAEEPQLATATALPQAYKDALVAMRQSLKNQDPLHGLNM